MRNCVRETDTGGHWPWATRSLTSRWTGVLTTDLVTTRTFSRPITTTRYGNISLATTTDKHDTSANKTTAKTCSTQTFLDDSSKCICLSQSTLDVIAMQQEEGTISDTALVKSVYLSTTNTSASSALATYSTIASCVTSLSCLDKWQNEMQNAVSIQNHLAMMLQPRNKYECDSCDSVK